MRSAVADTGRGRQATRASSTPTPILRPGYRDAPLSLAEARWDDGLSEFVLPYEVVRTAPDPDSLLIDFLQRTYEAAAASADWDRATLERTAGGTHG